LFIIKIEALNIEIGHQQLGPQIFDSPSEKEINLSFFKRGFGGNIKTLYRGIKYYDHNYMKKELVEIVNGLFPDS